MALHARGTNSPFGYENDSSNALDEFKRNFLAGGEVFGGGSSSMSQLLVLDNEKRELIKAPAASRGVKKGGVPEEKALAALRSHSEAERRRRERINSHLATLRGLVPCTDKVISILLILYKSVQTRSTAIWRFSSSGSQCSHSIETMAFLVALCGFSYRSR